MNEEQLNALTLRCRQAPVGGSLFIKRADLLELARAYSRLRNTALAIIENSDHVDVPLAVTMLQDVLGEE